MSNFIAPANVKDVLWERFAPSIPSLFARGIELAGRAVAGEGSRHAPARRILARNDPIKRP